MVAEAETDDAIAHDAERHPDGHPQLAFLLPRHRRALAQPTSGGGGAQTPVSLERHRHVVAQLNPARIGTSGQGVGAPKDSSMHSLIGEGDPIPEVTIGNPINRSRLPFGGDNRAIRHRGDCRSADKLHLQRIAARCNEEFLRSEAEHVAAGGELQDT